MDFFPDGSYVRLRSRGRLGKYVHANEDAVGVSLRRLSATRSLNAVWQVRLWPLQLGPGQGDVFHPFLLQGAAYGKCLAVAHEDEVVPAGYRGVRAVQRDYNLPHADPPFMWAAEMVEDSQDDYVRLRNHQRCLRANGRHRLWNNGVTVDIQNGNQTTMMHWMVEPVASTPVPLPLPPPPQPPIQARRGLFRRLTGHPVQPDQERMIRHRLTDDHGNYVNEDWPEFAFRGNSVSNLRTQLAQEHHVNEENITVCVRAGQNADMIPLVTDLPRNQDRMYILLIPTGTPAAARLRYPQATV